MQVKVFLPFVLLAVVLGSVNCANILFFSAFGTISTRISQWPLVEALAEKGHNVTWLSPLPNFELDPKKKSKISFYQPKVLASETKDLEDETGNVYDMRKDGAGGVSFTLATELVEIGVDTCEKLYADKEFIQWMKEQTFDLVIAETWMNECVLGMIGFWKAKLALYSTCVNTPWHPDSFGLPDETSIIPQLFTPFTSDMSFTERAINAIFPVGMNYLRYNDYFPKLEEITRKGLGTEVTPFREVEKNVTIMFMTQHYSIDFPRAYPPNIIPIGGNVVSKKMKPIPEDMQKFIDSSNGFIYVSFGTVVDFTRFDRNVQAEFVKALGLVTDMKFIWKSHSDINVTKIPDNVFVTKWAPQQSVLAHPKAKAYVTHSGMGSTTEAIHFSIPLVCVPLGGDQDTNANMIVRKGAGVKVEIVDMKREQLVAGIREILENKKYKDNMVKLTKIFKDRPMPILDSAVWWTEYVLRHDNVHEFLSHPSMQQPWWKRRQIDVWVSVALLLLIATIIPSYLVLIVVKKILSATSGKSNNVKQKIN